MKNNCLNKDLDILAKQIKIIGEPNRLKIICLLKSEPRCVCEIFEFLRLPQNLVSHHLKILLDARIITNERNGKKIIYSLSQKNTTKLLKKLKNILTI